MAYPLPQLRQELSRQAASILGAEQVVVEDANEKAKADLAIPVFAQAKELKCFPPQLAQELSAKLSHPAIERVEAAGGFVNVWLEPSFLAEGLDQMSRETFGNHELRKSQEIVVEHTDPNPFKELHIGHLYSNTVGESIARLLEASGANVHRVSYHGDVGLHIAKALWALGQASGWDVSRASKDMPFGSFYAEGAKAYEENPAAAAQIKELNQKIYERSDEDVNALYDWGKQKSFEYFERVYGRYDAPSFEHRFLESDSGPKGLEMVKANTPGVFETSEGAVVFRADEKEHTRVFVTSGGLPTYETKDLGLAALKREKFPDAKQFVIITANEINEYFKVVLEALGRIDADLAGKTRHLSHGLVKLPDGKMGSRTGRVVLAEELLDQVEAAVAKRAAKPKAAAANALGAIKYAFLKQNIGGDIVYDLEESVSLEGQSGPYVQYAAVRLQSVLDKVQADTESEDYDWQAEKDLLMTMARYPEVTHLAINELAPHRVAQYVYGLARQFNRYYENVPVKDAAAGAKSARLRVLGAGLNIIKHALGLLNVPTPREM